MFRPQKTVAAAAAEAKRAIKRLSLIALAQLGPLAQADDDRSEGLARVPDTTSARDALSMLLDGHTQKLEVVREEGGVVGLLDLQDLQRLLVTDANHSSDGIASAAGADGSGAGGVAPRDEERMR